MKQKLKRKDLYKLNNYVSNLINESCDKRCSFALYRNLEYWKGEITAITESEKPNSKYEEYEKKVVNVGSEYADKDEEGNPKKHLVEGKEMFLITEKKLEANAELAKLVKEYHNVIESKNEEINQFMEVLDDEVEIDICQVSFEYLPENSNYDILKTIIKETPEEIEEKYL